MKEKAIPRVLVKSSSPMYRNISRIVGTIGYEARHCRSYNTLKDALSGSDKNSYKAIIYYFTGFDERIPQFTPTVDIARELVQMCSRTILMGIYTNAPETFGLDMVLSMNGVDKMIPYSSFEGSKFEELLLNYLEEKRGIK